jgi:multidrug resistance protein
VRSRPFIALYIAVFVATLGISMVSPLLPVYAETLGASGVWLGLTFSGFAIVQTFFGPFAGRLSDRFGRKPFIVAGLCVYLIAALGYLTAENFYQVIAFRMFSGFGTSLIFSVARAYVGDMTPKGQEGRWLGVFATADIIGFGTGPLIAGLLRQEIAFRAVFVAMAALMALSATILLWWLPRYSPMEVLKRAHITGGGEREKAVPFAVAAKDRLVQAVTTHQTMISIASGSSFAFLAVRLENGLHASPIAIGVAFATQDLTGGCAQPFLGRLADTHSRRLLVAIGLALNGALVACAGIAPNYAVMVLLLFAMGASGALSQVAAGAIQIVAGRRVGMGTVLGINSAANGAGIVIGSLVGGLIYDQVSLAASFAFAGVVIMLGAPIFLALTAGQATQEPARVLAHEPALVEAAGGR